MRRLFAFLVVVASATRALAQAPPPVPALPDTERRTQYSISATTCACSVGFQVYQDSTDIDQWLQVYINGIRYLSNDSTHGWSLSSNTGSLGTLPRPITDAVLTFGAVQTGTVQIIGGQRPRRAVEVAENRGVSARDFNQFANSIVAMLRETWDLRNRTILAEPGFAFNLLPAATLRASLYLCFDNTGQITVCAGAPAGTSFAAGSGISFSGSNPTTIAATLGAGAGLVMSGVNLATATGVDINVLNAQTANYSIATTDCGKTIQLGTGSTGFFTLTVPAVAGFATTCSVKVVNGDTARGKAVAGLTGLTKLYPGQAFTAKIVNGAWALFDKPPRWQGSNPTIFIDKDTGSDTNDCLAATTGACLTSAQALSDASANIDYRGSIKFKYGCTTPPCTYQDLPFLAQSLIGNGPITVEGDTATPTNVVMKCAAACAGGAIFAFISNQNGFVGGSWTVQGFNTQSTLTGIFALFVQSNNINLTFQNMNFGALTGAGSHIGCAIQGSINSIGNYTISGGATAFADIEDGCVAHFTSGTGTLTGTPAFTQFLSVHGAGAIIGTDNTHFSGAATGKRFACTLMALIDTAGTSGSLPGNAAGTPTAGTLAADGCYVF